MRHQTFLRRHHQIRRQEQQAIAAGGFGDLAKSTAIACHNRSLQSPGSAVGLLHRGATTRAHFRGCQGKELAGATGSEQAGETLESEKQAQCSR